MTTSTGTSSAALTNPRHSTNGRYACCMQGHGTSSHHQMSLVIAGRGEMVLRRVSESAMVVYDRRNSQLSVVPWPAAASPSAEPGSTPDHADTCPNCGHTLPDRSESGESLSEYFMLLQQLNNGTTVPDQRPPSTSRISSASLSPGYFDRFFKTLGLLGRGSRAAVYLVEHVLDGVSIGKFALKKVPVGDDHAWLEKVLAEVHLLRKLSHPNLVKYNHVWLEVCAPSSFGPEVPCAFILQEYCSGGTLEDYVFRRKVAKPQRRLSFNADTANSDGTEYARSQDGRLSVREIKVLMTDIVGGVAHLHEQGIVHRDLKPSNCLLQPRKKGRFPVVLVSDFGESQLEGTHRGGTGTTGTLEYCAPELLRPVDGELPAFCKETDMYAIGMCLHFLCFSALPYSDAWEEHGDLEALKEEVSMYAFNFGTSNHEMNRTDLGGLIPLMRELLGPRKNRPSAAEVLERLATVEPPPPVAPVVPMPETEPGTRKRKRGAVDTANVLRAAKIASVFVIPASKETLQVLGGLAAIECFSDFATELAVAHFVVLLGSYFVRRS